MITRGNESRLTTTAAQIPRGASYQDRGPFGIPVRTSMRKTLREAGGPVMEKMGLAGIPAFMGIDISGSLKTQLPFAGTTPSDTVYGVYGGSGRSS